MNVLYIYRNPKQGPSIRRVFDPNARELCASANIQSISLPASTASFKSILSNIKYVFNYLNGKDFEVIRLTGDVYYLMWILARYNSVVTVHDLLFYTRMSPGIKKILKEQMTDRFDFPVTLAIEINEGKNWDEAH